MITRPCGSTWAAAGANPSYEDEAEQPLCPPARMLAGLVAPDAGTATISGRIYAALVSPGREAGGAGGGRVPSGPAGTTCGCVLHRVRLPAGPR
jgi:hypothetical protein